MSSKPSGEIVLYPRDDGAPALEVRLDGDTVWLTQDQMAELFGKAKSAINEHIKNIFEEGELLPERAMRKFGISEFSTKPTNFYNLDAVLAVGLRDTIVHEPAPPYVDRLPPKEVTHDTVYYPLREREE